MACKDVLNKGFSRVLLLFSIVGLCELIFILIDFIQRDTSRLGMVNGSISRQGTRNIGMGNVPIGQSEVDTGRPPELIKRSNLRIERWGTGRF